MADTSDEVAAQQTAGSGHGTSGNAPASSSAAPSEAAKCAGLTTIIVVMVIFIRILAVSGWDWNTAAELADAFDFSDTVPIFLGTLFELPLATGVGAALILPIACYRVYLMYKRGDGRGAAADWLLVLLLAIILFVLDHTYQVWWPMILALAWGAALALFVRFVHRGGALSLLQAVTRHIGALVLICFLTLAVVVATPWNPTEDIALSDGTVLVGHVIDAEPGFLTVLTEDRDVRTILTGDVVSRTTVDISAKDATN